MSEGSLFKRCLLHLDESSTKGIGGCVTARTHVSDDVYETR